MSNLYITDNGATINVDGGYFVVKYKNDMLQKLPKETLESICLFGNASMTMACVRECLYKGIPVSYFSSNGAYYGRLESTGFHNIGRIKKQMLLTENEEFCLELSKKLIYAKINNQMVVLRRYCKNGSEEIKDEIITLKYALKNVKVATDYKSLMGYEGMAARNYFLGLSKLVKKDFTFNGRNRMPPKDAFNSMLSMGYTLIMYEIYGELENKGLSPYAGFLHQDRERHPTLASDLMEEWRAVLVDSVVMSLVQGNEIDIEEFTKDTENGAVLMSKKALGIFIKKLENKLHSETGYIDSTYKMSFRRALGHQAACLAKMIDEENISNYEPVVIR